MFIHSKMLSEVASLHTKEGERWRQSSEFCRPLTSVFVGAVWSTKVAVFSPTYCVPTGLLDSLVT